MELLESEAELETARNQLNLALAAQEEAKAQGETDQLHSRIVEEFEKEPAAISLINDINNAKNRWKTPGTWRDSPTSRR